MIVIASTLLLLFMAVVLHSLGKIMTALQNLIAAVAAETSVSQSAVTLLNAIPGLIAAAGTDPVALQALADSITANTTSLAAAVTANTPAAAPAPSPAPAPSAPTVVGSPVTNADGSVTTTFSDGSTSTVATDGTVTTTPPTTP